MLGLPIGLPVRLLKPIPKARMVLVEQSGSRFDAIRARQGRDSWSAWVRKKVVSPFKTPAGCAAGDLAVIVDTHGNGSYTLALQDDSAILPDLKANTAGTIEPSSLSSRAIDMDTKSFRPLLAAAISPQAVFDEIRLSHDREVARLTAAKAVMERSRCGLLGMPRGTAVHAEGVGNGFVVAYVPNSSAYAVARSSEAQAALAFPVQVPAHKVRPLFHRAVDPDMALQELETKHQAEMERLKCAVLANELASSFLPNLLPVGTVVEFPEGTVAMPEYGHFQCWGRIVRSPDHAEFSGHYILQLEPFAGTTSLSSDSRVAVSVNAVRPIFWASSDPLAEAHALGKSLGLDKAESALHYTQVTEYENAPGAE